MPRYLVVMVILELSGMLAIYVYIVVPYNKVCPVPVFEDVTRPFSIVALLFLCV